MLSLRAGRGGQPQRRAGAPGRSVRRASENATKVPLSKKCKLDIKRKHLRAAIPGCLAVNSYAVNLQLQIDGEKLPDLYKCTIKKHVNNKTSCVSYRLQGTGIYNHLRGLYMRGFSCGEEPGVVVLVASREAAPDLCYGGLSEGEDADCVPEARAVFKEDNTDSEAERRQQRQRRQQQQRSRKQQRKRRRDDDTDEEDEEYEPTWQAAVKEEAADLALAGPSGRCPAFYLPPHGHGAAAALAFHHFQHPQLHPYDQQSYEQHPRDQHRHQLLRSHPVQAAEASPPAGAAGEAVQVGLHAHALSSLADDSAALMCHETQQDDAVSALNAPCADEGLAALAEAERRATQAGPGPGSGLDPFDHLGLGVGLGAGMGCVGGVGDGGASLLTAGGPGHVCLLGSGLLDPPEAGVCSVAEASQPHDGAATSVLVGGDTDGGGLHNAGTSLPDSFHAQRDPLLDLPLSQSPFSPRVLAELTGRPHLPRVGGYQPPSQLTNGWDFDASFNSWSRQHLSWPDSLSLGLM